MGGVTRSLDRPALADFLRRRREAVAPAEVGLPTGPRRRTGGLRREEVAQLAGLSVDYVVRLEQGRSSVPSDQVLAALARALRLSDDERDHLHLLAGTNPPVRGARHPHVRRAVLHLLDAVGDAGAFVCSDLGHLLAANPLAVSLLGRAPGGTTREESLVWRWFTDPAERQRVPQDDHGQTGRVWAADLRAASARHPGDPDVAALVGGLQRRSAEFRRIWGEHEVAVRRGDRKRLVHPQHGLLELDCEVLVMPEGDQRLVLLSAAPGSPEVDRLALLRVVGEQAMGPVPQRG